MSRSHDGFRADIREVNGYIVIARRHWNDSMPMPQLVLTEREARQAIEGLEVVLNTMEDEDG